MMQPLFEYLTVPQYAKRFNVSANTVRRWLKAKQLEAQRIGPRGHYRIKVIAAQQKAS